MASFFLIQLNYIYDIASMKNSSYNSFLRYHDKGLRKKSI